MHERILELVRWGFCLIVKDLSLHQNAHLDTKVTETSNNKPDGSPSGRKEPPMRKFLINDDARSVSYLSPSRRNLTDTQEVIEAQLNEARALRPHPKTTAFNPITSNTQNQRI